ncbi:MAG: hypothetical protein PHG19_04680 [Anaerotignum sp.]|nr:hypothetical protein [Anaerotignum sp.]
MRKPLTDGFTREIIVVSFDNAGNRIERDFDLLPEEEKTRLRIQNHQRSLKAAGYVKVENGLAAK